MSSIQVVQGQLGYFHRVEALCGRLAMATANTMETQINSLSDSSLTYHSRKYCEWESYLKADFIAPIANYIRSLTGSSNTVEKWL